MTASLSRRCREALICRLAAAQIDGVIPADSGLGTKTAAAAAAVATVATTTILKPFFSRFFDVGAPGKLAFPFRVGGLHVAEAKKVRSSHLGTKLSRSSEQ